MVAVSFSISRGVSGTKMSDVTVGTSAPGAGDIEFRFNVLDTNGKNMNDKDLIIALEAFERYLLTSGPKVSVTTQPSGPP